MKNIKRYIYEQVAKHNLSEEDAKNMLLEVKENTHQDIAIVGMSGKFSTADNVEEYWANIVNGVNSVRETPQSRRPDMETYLKRFSYDRLVENNAIRPDGSLDLKYEKQGFLESIDKFDANFFRIPPREAKAMSAEQRLFLEVAYEALEDAGYGGKSLYGSNTAVFVGLDHSVGLTYKEISQTDAMSATGNWPGILASRISYIFNFKGPAMVIDTACASGLVSVHEAIKSLNNGECDTAIAGGVSAIVYDASINENVVKDLDSVESKKGIVRAFDNGVDGTAWGEGVGAVVLKKLDKAIEDGDDIYAVIKGSAINNDGASNGITAPDVEMQERLLLAAWENANVSPETISYIEAHGTGTKLGDSIELKALTEAFGKKTNKKQFCGIGSVKSGIGHLVAASGLSGLIKVILMLKNNTMPANVNFTRPNRFIDFMNSPVYVCDQNKPWVREGDTLRRAGISSFGFSGTNCHVVVEEYVKPEKEVQAKPFHIFTLSGKTENAMHTMVNNYINYLEKEAVDLGDLCYTLAVGRGHYEYRLAAAVQSKEELLKALKEYAATGKSVLIKDGYYRVVNKVRDAGVEITEGERRSLTGQAKDYVSALQSNDDQTTADALIDLYMKGADIEWEALYKDTAYSKKHLPYYPLERERCWFEETPEETEARMNKRKQVMDNEINHPLVHKTIADSMDQHIFSTKFSAQRQWELNEHRIWGNHVLPGTTYVEMAVETCKNYYEQGMLFKNIAFYLPMVLEEGEERECHTVLNKKGECLDVTFASKKETEFGPEWIKHSDCKVYELNEPMKHVDIEAIKAGIASRITSEKSVADKCPNKEEATTVKLGKRWMNDDIVVANDREVFVKLTIPKGLEGDMPLYNLHVALLDNAVNEVTQVFGDGLRLPFYYKEFKYYNKMPSEFYSYIKIKTKDLVDPETVTYDVQMIDLDGNVFAEALDYSIKLVNKTQEEFSGQGKHADKFYHLNWVNKEVASIKQDLGNVLVFKGNSHLSKALCETLKKEHKVIEIEQGTTYEKVSEDKYIIGNAEADYAKLLNELKAEGIGSILHLNTLDEANTNADLSVEALQAEKQKSIDSVFYLTRALVTAHYSNDINLYLVTDHAFKVVDTDSCIKPHHRAYLALGKVVGDENANIKCHAIDVAEDMTETQLVEAITNKKDCYQVAYRNNGVYVEAFEEAEVTGESEIPVERNGVYLITGGTGGLGLEAAKYLASKQKVNIVLVGRSELPSKRDWFNILNGDNEKQKEIIKGILDIEDMNSNVTYMRGNVSNKEEMTTIWNDVKADFGKINGVFHCAGVAGDGLIITKDKARFDQVITPKVDGTLILGNLMMEDKVDFIVFYSSMTSLFAGVGQSDYCIANNYMDGYSELLNTKGIRALAVNWPAWKEVGMAVAYGVDDMSNYMLSIGTEDAFKDLEKVMQTSLTQVMPGKLNPGYLKGNKEKLTFAIGDKISKEISKAKQIKRDNGKQESSKQTTNMNTSYDTIEDFLLAAWCEVLGTDKIDIYDSFSRLGGDSLMAIQLLKIIDKVYPDIVSVPDIFTYSSVVDMAEFIKSKIGTEEVQEAEAEAAVAVEEDIDLDSMLDAIESGEVSIDSVLEKLE